MTILRRKVKRVRREEAQFLGVYIPKRMGSYFSLYCLSIGMTKSFVLKSMLLEWMDRTKATLPRDVIIKNVAHKAFEVWKNPEGRRKNFNSFKSELAIELKFKGLEDCVDEIIEIIENEKRTNEEC
jgi:hypothetical protein